MHGCCIKCTDESVFQTRIITVGPGSDITVAKRLNLSGQYKWVGMKIGRIQAQLITSRCPDSRKTTCVYNVMLVVKIIMLYPLDLTLAAMPFRC